MAERPITPVAPLVVTAILFLLLSWVALQVVLIAVPSLIRGLMAVWPS